MADSPKVWLWAFIRLGLRGASIPTVESPVHLAAIEGPPMEDSKSVGLSPVLMTSLVFLCSLGLMLFIAWHYRAEISDDAYIHLRIARNLVQTGHPYFNAHEPVMVTSSPVWTLLLAFNEMLLGARNVLWFWNAIFAALAATFAYSLVSKLPQTSRWQARSFTLLVPLTVLAMLADSAFLGMETPLAIALLLLAALAFMKRSSTALPLLALAGFTRYEIFVLLAAAILVCLGTRTAKKYGAITASIVTAVLTVWLFTQFGTIIPNAVKAKSKGYVLSAAQSFAMLWHERVVSVRVVNILFLFVLAVILLFLVSSWAGEVVTRRRRRDTYWIVALSLLLWGCVLSALYVWRRTFIFAWYTPLVFVPLFVGAAMLVSVDESSLRKAMGSLFLLAAFLPSYHYFGLLIRSAATNDPSRIVLLNESARVHAYLVVGRALNEACSGSQLLTSEIGALGYSFQGEILDGFGLASPEAIKYQPTPMPEGYGTPWGGAIPTEFALAKKADLIVSYDHWGQALLSSPEIHSEYDDLTFPPLVPLDIAEGLKPPWGIKALHVLVKKGGVCPVARVAASVAAGTSGTSEYQVP